MKVAHEELARNRDEVITIVFRKTFKPGEAEHPFTIADVRAAIAKVSKTRPNYKETNVADIRYEYAAGRRLLPKAVDSLGPWMIVGRGKGKYAFIKIAEPPAVKIQDDLYTTRLPDATPEIVLEYAGGDEQGILAKVRYNRMIDIFLGITCYHLQNHLRTYIRKKGQLEIDDLYVGLNATGKQFVIPIEAKSVKDHLSKTQIMQAIDFARERYPRLIMRPIGIQEMADGSLVLVEFTAARHPDEIKIVGMRRYGLVPMSEVPLDELQSRA
ncbi:MAG: endonuclease [Verrucomicrobiia bacterium]